MAYKINNLPKTWKKVKVKNVAKVNKSTISEKYHTENIEYIDISSVGEREMLPPVPMAFSNAPSRAKRLLSDGDTLISTVRPNLRHFTYLKEVEQNWVASTGFAVISPKDEVDSRFLYYYLTSDSFVDYLSAVADGAAYPAFNPKEVEEAELAYPSLSEQKAIAGVLGALDDKIELNRKMNETLEEMAQAIFKSWFIDFDTVKAKAKSQKPFGMDAETAALFPDSFEDSPLGNIPKGWKVSRLSEITSTQYGYTETATDKPVGPHFLRVKDINKQNWIEWSKVPFCSISQDDYKKYKLKMGDIVVSRMADPGKSAIVEQDVKAVFASYLVKLETNSLSKAYYIYGFLKSPLYQEYVLGAKSGSVQSSMNAKVITAVKLALPQHKLIEAYFELILPLRNKICTNLEENLSLENIRNALLPKLLSGEIRVEAK